MWFKNLQYFEFIDQYETNAESLAANLEEMAFTPCPPHQPMSLGWFPPLQEEGASLIHAANGCIMLCLKTEEKILPATVIREELMKKIQEIEKSQDRKVYKKERETLKSEITEMLLRRAFTKSALLYGYIDTNHQRLIINTASQNKAEFFASHLRKSLGSLKIQLPQINAPSVFLSEWLAKNEAPGQYEIDDYCVLIDNQEQGAIIRCQHQDLDNEHITALLEDGNRVSELGLRFGEQIAFVITDNFIFKKLRYLNLVTDKLNDTFTETEAERFDADFVIMTESLAELIKSMTELFSSPIKAKEKA